MKITALSDVHGKSLSLVEPHGADLCIIAGDIAPCHAINDWEKRRQLKWIKEDFCEFIDCHPNTEFVFVAGNHDFWGEQCTGLEEWWPRNAHYLKNNSIIMFDGLLIWGSPYVPYIGYSRRWAFETSNERLDEYYSKIPIGTNIIVTHEPPRIPGSMIDVPCGVTDDSTGHPLHLGSPELTDAIDRVKPDYVFCGHIHTGDHHEHQRGDTHCYNVSMLDEQYNNSFYSLQFYI